MTPESRPSLHSLRTSTSHLSVAQSSHGLPTPVSPDPFHFDKVSPLPTPTPRAISVSSQHSSDCRDISHLPVDRPGSHADQSHVHTSDDQWQKATLSYDVYKPKRPVNLRRGSSLQRLHLDAAKERDRFGLGGLTVSTSPNDEIREPGRLYDEAIDKDDQLFDDDLQDDHTISPDPLRPHDIDPLLRPDPLVNKPCPAGELVVTMADMSKSDTIRAPTLSAPIAHSPPSNHHSSRTPTASIPVPGVPSSRRQPVPPSPLSRIQSEPHASTSHRTPPHGHHPTNHGYSSIPENSPCFIHSHLDRTGSMQDWLKQKNAQLSPEHARSHPQTGTSPRTQAAHGRHVLHNGPTPVHSVSGHGGSHHQHTAHHAQHRSHAPHHTGTRSPAISPSGSKMTSPVFDGALNGARVVGREGSGSGYDSDRSSQVGGSAVQDGDVLDDEEEGGSLTKQLAETAQGVREMSKELGRTRVRSRIQHVLIVTKARDNRLIKLTRELALYLMLKKPASSAETPTRPGTANERGMVVYVDAQLRTSKRFDAAGLQKEYPQLFEPVGRRRSSSTASVNTLHSTYPSSSSLNGDGFGVNGRRKDEGQLRYWTGEMCSNSPHLFDFVVTLGGDGTVLFTSWLFQRIVPPVLPFALGSLGFLTNFDFAKYKPTMDKVIDDGIRVNLRMRFTCTVYRAIAPEEAAQASAKGKTRKAIKKPGGEILMSQVDKGGWEALEGPPRSDGESDEGAVVEGRDKEIMCFSTRPVEQFEVLNDLVVDRGPSPFVSLLELFGDEHHLTTVQADGLTVSTPTGSTAYSLSAGGSLVHPQIPAILITPICPHTLSFRPMLLPDSMELRICVPYNSRSTAWASFDGRGRVELKQGDHIKVTASKYPFPTVCADKASTDWFGSISRTLRWNEREKQKSFVVVEEDNEPSSSATRPKKGMTQAESRKAAEKVHKELKEVEEPASEEEDAEDDEEEEEEDDFDIDDKSGGEDTNPSSPQNQPTDPHIPLLSRLDSSYHKPGVDSPDRFATPYAAPPPLSQRHLVEALAAAELDSKDGEVGQRDEIRAGPGEMRVEAGRGGHLIPPGRAPLVVRDGDQAHQDHPATHQDPAASHHSQQVGHGEGESGNANIAEKTPRPRAGRSISDLSVEVKRHTKKREEICKAKAFAFFGQDDSASDQSDEASEC